MDFDVGLLRRHTLIRGVKRGLEHNRRLGKQTVSSERGQGLIFMGRLDVWTLETEKTIEGKDSKTPLSLNAQ